jgi:DNA processing protein
MKNKRLISTYLKLNKIPNLGPVRVKILLDYFRKGEEILKASLEELKKIPGIGDSIASNIIKFKDEIEVEEELRKIEEDEVEIITLEEEDYPQALKNIFDPPILLYVKGRLKKEENCIAIVGSRMATSYGRRVAEEMARDLSIRGFTIVSGMARGIDTFAHKGALGVNGRTIAVLGCGIDVCYPPENKRIKEEIIKKGAVISEFPYGTIPDKINFPQRNRIISGLCKGVLVVEAWSKSGSLITANYALEQGREVFAIPGRIYSKFSEGTHNLIKQGAKLVNSSQDILEEFNLLNKRETSSNIYESLDIKEKKIYSLITKEPIHIDDIARVAGENIINVSQILTRLEIKGVIRQIEGKRYLLN